MYCSSCLKYGLYSSINDRSCPFCSQSEAVVTMIRYFTRATSEWSWKNGRRVKRPQRNNHVER